MTESKETRENKLSIPRAERGSRKEKGKNIGGGRGEVKRGGFGGREEGEEKKERVRKQLAEWRKDVFLPTYVQKRVSQHFPLSLSSTSDLLSSPISSFLFLQDGPSKERERGKRERGP